MGNVYFVVVKGSLYSHSIHLSSMKHTMRHKQQVSNVHKQPHTYIKPIKKTTYTLPSPPTESTSFSTTKASPDKVRPNLSHPIPSHHNSRPSAPGREERRTNTICNDATQRHSNTTMPSRARRMLACKHGWLTHAGVVLCQSPPSPHVQV